MRGNEGEGCARPSLPARCIGLPFLLLMLLLAVLTPAGRGGWMGYSLRARAFGAGDFFPFVIFRFPAERARLSSSLCV